MDWKTRLAPRVERGAELLDKLRPGWATEIALDQLAMETCGSCILGQLCGDYITGCIELNMVAPEKFDSSGKFGFTLKDDEQNRNEDAEVDEGFQTLADLWRAEVRERLEANR